MRFCHLQRMPELTPTITLINTMQLLTIDCIITERINNLWPAEQCRLACPAILEMPLSFAIVHRSITVIFVKQQISNTWIKTGKCCSQTAGSAKCRLDSGQYTLYRLLVITLHVLHHFGQCALHRQLPWLLPTISVQNTFILRAATIVLNAPKKPHEFWE